MNIVKLQSQLQKLPDQALIGYVQNPDGQVPSYLALAELTRRKEIRQSAAPRQPAPTQTVAQQAVAESQPGIAQLPLRDEQMFSEQAMAAGGIVSFEEGGEVPGFSDGSYSKYMEAWNRRQKELADPSLQSSWMRRNVLEPLQYNTLRAEAVRDLNTYDYGMPWTPRSENELRAIKEREKIAADIAAGKYDPTGKELVPTVGAPEKLVVDKPTADKTIADKSTVDRTKTDKVPALVGANTSGIKSLEWKDIEADSQGYRDIMRPEVSAQEKMAEMQGLLGVDPARAAMKERLEGMEARTAKEEERAPWMALAEAGLGMAAGRSQFAVQNIAEGAKSGLSSLAAAKERVNNAKEKQFEIANRMAQAERAEQVAAAKYGQESSEAIKARNDQVKLAEQSNKNEISLKNAVGKFEAQKGNAEIALKKADLAQTAAANSAKLQMMQKQILSQGLASQARLAAIRQKALADLKNNESYGLQLNAIAAKYKDSGGVQNPMYKQEVKALENEFMANALETIFDTGLGANALSADSIVPLGD
jgi:hypothetical protein